MINKYIVDLQIKNRSQQMWLKRMHQTLIHAEGYLNLTNKRSQLSIDITQLLIDYDEYIDKTKAGTSEHKNKIINKPGGAKKVFIDGNPYPEY